MRIARNLFGEQLTPYRTVAFAGLIVLGGLLSLSGKTWYGLTILVWLAILLMVGTLLLSWLGVKSRLNLVEWIIYSYGLAVATLMLLGLILNTIGLAIGQPLLREVPLVPLVVGASLALLWVSWARKVGFAYLPRQPDQSLRGWQRAYVLVSLAFPLLAFFGAERLNNGNSAGLAMFTIALIIAYLLSTVKFRHLLMDSDYAVTLFCTALATVLSFSLRSNHVVGNDIQQEFQVFTATLRSGLWYPYLYNSTYNACLSITILPTVLKLLVPISAEYIFKFLMQLIFCLVPLCAYAIALKVLGGNKWQAFVAALFLIVQNQFFEQFPALIRQEVALLFFGLVFVALVDSKLTRLARDVLVICFGTAMIISHYSTAYICIALLAIFMSIRWLYKKFAGHRFQNFLGANWHVSGNILALLFLISFVWYAQILQSTGGVIQKTYASITGIGNIFSGDSRSGFIATTFHIGTDSYSTGSLEQLAIAHTAPNNLASATNSSYTPTPVSVFSLNPNNLWQHVSYVIFDNLVLLAVKLVVITGVIYALYLWAKKRLSADVIFLTFSVSILFALLILLPGLSLDYNLERLYVQILVLTGSLFIFGIAGLLSKFPKVMSVAAITLVCLYYAATSGFADQLAFGTSNVVGVNNSIAGTGGTYLKDGDVLSLAWLSGQYKTDPAQINLDHYGVLHADAYSTLPAGATTEGIQPSEVSLHNYVYASSVNYLHGVTYDQDNNVVATFNFPKGFYSSSKNTIYSNGDSVIYK